VRLTITVPRQAFHWFHGIIAVVCLATSVTVVMALIEIPLWHSDPWLALSNVLVTMSFVFAGLILRKSHKQRRTGWTLILAGIVHPLGWWDQWNFGPFPFYATVFGELDDILGVSALLRYPAERLTRYQRLYVAVLATWLLGGRLLLATLSRPTDYPGISPSAWWPTLYPSYHLFTVGMTVLHIGIFVLLGVLLFLLSLRFRALDRPGPHVLVPLSTMGSFGILAAVTATILDTLRLPLPQLFTIESIVGALLIPFTFAWIGVWTLRPAIGLMTELPGLASEQKIEERVRHHLDTNEFHIIHWDSRQDCYVDVSGQTTELPEPSERSVVISLDDRDDKDATIYAVVSADTAERHPQLLEVALGMLALVLRNLRLDILLDDQDYWERKISKLDERELEVLRLFAEEGMKTKQIATKLVYHHRTIENVRDGIYRKLGVKGASDPEREAALIWQRAKKVFE
jgi:DNA-binding CsgD family transcriptional regulator